MTRFISDSLDIVENSSDNWYHHPYTDPLSSIGTLDTINMYFYFSSAEQTAWYIEHR